MKNKISYIVLFAAMLFLTLPQQSQAQLALTVQNASGSFVNVEADPAPIVCPGVSTYRLTNYVEGCHTLTIPTVNGFILSEPDPNNSNQFQIDWSDFDSQNFTVNP